MELKKIYKEMKFKIGVFQLKNTANQKIFAGSSTDLNAIWNRMRTELKFGNYPNVELQKYWKKFGEENLIFEIVSEIKQEENDKNVNYRKEVKHREKILKSSNLLVTGDITKKYLNKKEGNPFNAYSRIRA